MEETYGIIYIVTNLVNGKQYVGQTTRLEKRFKEHLRVSQVQCPVMNKAIRKYGSENFSFDTLAKAKSQDELNEMEKSFIKKLKTLAPYGYNLSPGGLGTSGYKHSKKSKENMSITRKKGLADGSIPNVWIGRKHTEETKNKLRRPKTEEHKRSLSKAKKGKPATNGFREDPEKRKRAYKIHQLKQKGYLQIDISKQLNVSEAFVSFVVNGKQFPDIREKFRSIT